jgi:hypothetical protein
LGENISRCVCMTICDIANEEALKHYTSQYQPTTTSHLN